MLSGHKSPTTNQPTWHPIKTTPMLNMNRQNQKQHSDLELGGGRRAAVLPSTGLVGPEGGNTAPFITCKALTWKHKNAVVSGCLTFKQAWRGSGTGFTYRQGRVQEPVDKISIHIPRCGWRSSLYKKWKKQLQQVEPLVPPSNWYLY